MHTIESHKTPAFVALAALLLAASILISSAHSPKKGAAPASSAVRLEPSHIEARAAVVFDPVTGETLFAKNAEVQLPLASLAKLLTAYLALERDEGRRVVITRDDLLEEGDTGLAVGESWTLSSLISFALVTSSNDAIAAAARATSIDPRATSEAAKVLELPQTFALNPTGLDFSSSTAGAYGSAYDVAHLLALILGKYPDVLSKTAAAESVFENLEGNAHKATSTGRFITDIPGIIAMKTGYTDLAGGNLAVAYDRGFGRPLIAVVLGSSRDGRFMDMRALIDATRGNAL